MSFSDMNWMETAKGLEESGKKVFVLTPAVSTNLQLGLAFFLRTDLQFYGTK